MSGSRGTMRAQNRFRRLILATAVIAVTVVAFGASTASAAGQFTFLQPGFTQSLYGFAGAFFGGVAFAPNNDPWVDTCQFGGSPLYQFDSTSTILVNGSNV